MCCKRITYIDWSVERRVWTVYPIMILCIFIAGRFMNNINILSKSKVVDAYYISNNETTFNIIYQGKDGDYYYKTCEYLMGDKDVLQKNETILQAKIELYYFILEKIYEPIDPFCPYEILQFGSLTIFYLVVSCSLVISLIFIFYDIHLYDKIKEAENKVE